MLGVCGFSAAAYLSASWNFAFLSRLFLLCEAGVRSFMITFNVYVILKFFEKYDNERPDSMTAMTVE
jgi:hypothetical protein